MNVLFPVSYCNVLTRVVGGKQVCIGGDNEACSLAAVYAPQAVSQTGGYGETAGSGAPE